MYRDTRAARSSLNSNLLLVDRPVLFNKRFLMKYFFGVVVLFCVSYGSDLSATPIFVYNHGYVMGELNGVDLIGVNRKIVAGKVSIGNNSFSGGNDVRDEFRSKLRLKRVRRQEMMCDLDNRLCA